VLNSKIIKLLHYKAKYFLGSVTSVQARLMLRSFLSITITTKAIYYSQSKVERFFLRGFVDLYCKCCYHNWCNAGKISLHHYAL